VETSPPGSFIKEKDMKKLALGTLAITILILGVSPALAGSAAANIGVSANIVDVCTITTGAVAFGAYDPIVTNATAALNGSGTVTIVCTRGATTTVGLGLGGHAAGSVRKMQDAGTDQMAYELYQPPSTTPGAACSYSSPTVWGNSGAGLFTPASAPSFLARTYNVCGQVAAGQDLPAGSYNDTVVATVNF
jgi:spore coat protein U-like protein